MLGLFSSDIMFLLLYLLVWRALPPWMQNTARVMFYFSCFVGILLFFRMGVFSVFGEVFTEMGKSLWDMVKALGVLCVYALTGYCMSVNGCVPP